MKKIAVLLLLVVVGVLTACNTPNDSKTIELSSLLGIKYLLMCLLKI